MLTPNLIGVLDRDLMVTVLDISRGGCLLESSRPIPPGTVAGLMVRIDGAAYREYVRIARCLPVPGGGERHHVGVEFLTLTRPGRASLRCYAAALGESPEAEA